MRRVNQPPKWRRRPITVWRRLIVIWDSTTRSGSVGKRRWMRRRLLMRSTAQSTWWNSIWPLIVCWSRLMIDFWARRRTINLLTWEDKAMLGSNLSACVRPGYHAGEASARGFSRPELYLGSNALNPALRLTDLFDQRSVLPTGVPNGNIAGAWDHSLIPCYIQATPTGLRGVMA